MTYDLFNQLIYTDGDFSVIADYTGNRSNFTQYDVYYKDQWIGTTNTTYYMGAVRHIIQTYKNFLNNNPPREL